MKLYFENFPNWTSPIKVSPLFAHEQMPMQNTFKTHMGPFKSAHHLLPTICPQFIAHYLLQTICCPPCTFPGGLNAHHSLATIYCHYIYCPLHIDHYCCPPFAHNLLPPRYIPWWLECNPARYPYWFGNPEPRNKNLLLEFQNHIR